MTICYFGGYNATYSRSRILLKGFRENGVKIIECHDRSAFPLNLFRLFLKHWRIRKDCDVLFVGFPGQAAAILAKFITRKPVILDAFISLYNSVIEDRKENSPRSLRALYYLLLDWLSMRIADGVVLDTEEHVNYFINKYKGDKSKFIVARIGAEDDIFSPRPKIAAGKFIVGFHGTYIPLQGAQYIVQAAGLLKDEQDIEFRMVGNGQTFKEVKDSADRLQLKNTIFLSERMPYEKIPDFIAGADVCLGIFGDTLKTRMVIPNKLYECIAMAKPVITGDTPAVRESFIDGENIFLVPAANPEKLAQKILELRSNGLLLRRVAENGHRLFKEQFTPKRIAEKLLSDMNPVRDIKG